MRTGDILSILDSFSGIDVLGHKRNILDGTKKQNVDIMRGSLKTGNTMARKPPLYLHEVFHWNID